MSFILFHYEKVNPTSWAYLSSLLMLALFFKFNRVFSIRNLDLFLLILIAPGLLLVQYSIETLPPNPTASAAEVQSGSNDVANAGDAQSGALAEPAVEGDETDALEMQKLGFLWMFAVGGLITARLLLDSALVRRPLLEPNLNAAGLTFLGSSLLFFLMANVVTGQPGRADCSPALPAASVKAEQETGDSFETEGPGFWLLYLLPRISTQKVIAGADATPPSTEDERAAQQLLVGKITARVMAILSHVLIVIGLVLVGGRHFDNLTAGIAAATMYLLLPYTALWSGSVEHALPASLLVWAIACYRRPLLAGILIGLASGTIYYPLFLLPLWCSFYWERGVKRFLGGVLISVAALVLTLALTAGSFDRFLETLWQMFGVRLPPIKNLQGIWRQEEGFWNSWYRLPILATFVILSISFAAWPVRKHLGTLISCTAALMAGAQFWHPHDGGIYVAWYLPLLLLTIYRPNLEDRVALTTIAEGWRQSRKRMQAAQATATA